MQDYYEVAGREAIDVIEYVVAPLQGKDALNLGMLLKYVLRAGYKPGESYERDLEKARDYAVRLCEGRWEHEQVHHAG